jgi:hypothetical protein
VANAEERYRNAIVPHLVDVWMKDYSSRTSAGEVVETSAAGFSYLFDISSGRLIAAWGVSITRGGCDAATL